MRSIRNTCAADVLLPSRVVLRGNYASYSARPRFFVPPAPPPRITSAPRCRVSKREHRKSIHRILPVTRPTESCRHDSTRRRLQQGRAATLSRERAAACGGRRRTISSSARPLRQRLSSSYLRLSAGGVASHGPPCTTTPTRSPAHPW